MDKPKKEQEPKLIDTSKNKRLSFLKTLFVPFSQVLHVTMRYQQAKLRDKKNPRILSAWEAFQEIREQPKGRAPDSFKYSVFVKKILKALLNREVPDVYVYPSSVKAVLDTLARQPIAPFLRGTIPGAAKEFVKNASYKAPLILGAPHLANRIIPSQVADYTHPLVHHIVFACTAGTIAGLADGIIGGPIDCYATFRATSHGEYAEASFYKELTASGTIQGAVERVYQGLGVTIAKCGVAYTTYFFMKEPVKKKFAEYYEPESWQYKFVTAVGVGTAVAITSSGLDIIKTGLQMPGAKKDTIFGAFMKNVKEHGAKGALTGVPLKATIAAAGWGLTFFATQTVEDVLPLIKESSPGLSKNSE